MEVFDHQYKSLVIVCSDRASRGIYPDESGASAKTWLTQNGYLVDDVKIIPDDSRMLMKLVNELNDTVELVIISGGTGLGPRDVTPQTLDLICDYQIPGFGQLMRQESLKYSRNAYLSRCGGWIKNRSLILALPGNPNAVTEQLNICVDLLKHALLSMKGKCRDRRKVKNIRQDDQSLSR